MASIDHIKKRCDFVRLTREGVHYVSPSFIVQLYRNDRDCLRVGVTATKKLGNAVVRNRAKRRLRVLSKLLFDPLCQESWDIVFVGRQSVLKKPFSALLIELDRVRAQIKEAGI